MDIRKISVDLSASAQISPSDVVKLKGLGFRSIIVHRPDGEGDDQPAFAAIETVANEVGMKASYIPVVPGQISDNHIDQFCAALETLPTPILAYCRTGTRAAMLWSLSEGVKGRPVSEILKTTEAAGYDISSLEPRITALATS